MSTLDEKITKICKTFKYHDVFFSYLNDLAHLAALFSLVCPVIVVSNFISDIFLSKTFVVFQHYKNIMRVGF